MEVIHMKRKSLFINCKNNGYKATQCGRTLTVGELIDLLSDFDEDTPVYLRFDNGYTYGSIGEDDLFKEEELEEEEE
jgi:hypothetical protein